MGPKPMLGRPALVVQAVAAVVFVALLLSAEGVRLPFTGAGDWTIRAAFADAGGIHSGERTPVLVSGVPVGEVTDVRVGDGGLALVTIRLDASTRGVIRRDASAAIEPRSALEDMTIDITPGSARYPAARDGGTIPATQTVPTTSLDRVLSVLDADTRTQLAIMLDQLTRGVGGRGGELAAAVEQLHGLLDPATQVASALARRRVLLASLVHSLAGIGVAASAQDAAIGSSLADGARTLAVTADREAAVRSSVAALPATLSAVRSALSGVSRLAAPLDPAVSGLGATARALPAALSSVRAAVPALTSLVGAARAFAVDGAAGLRSAAGAFGELGPTARAVTPAVARIQPIVQAVNANRSGIAQLGERFSGVLSTDDENGPILRGLGFFEPFNPADFGAPGATGAAKLAVETQTVQALALTCQRGGFVACLIRYLVPGLPGSVR
jgi:phospholipid/cholesterol/gamma-HCH transport system substrate-binding protein